MNNKIMPTFTSWRLGILVSCGATIAVVIGIRNYLNKLSKKKLDNVNKNNEEKIEKIEYSSNEDLKNFEINLISELPNPRWIKVGEIKELYFYPLKSGRGKIIDQCAFTEYGISIVSDTHLTLRDRMFLVYNEDNGKFITGRNYPTLILVSLYAVDEFNVKLEAVGMPSLIFKLPKNSMTTHANVDCTMWWGEPIKCIDCGDESAQWISKFLTGTNSGLRIGLAPLSRRNILKGPWEKFTKIYNTLRNDDTGLFSDIASYMLMTESSLDELNKRLKNPVSFLQFRPNIVVTGPHPFVEDDWEWIKIGDSVVIRNVKPCPRCKMIRINPETGIADEYEPLETLKTFREQNDPVKISVDGKAPILGIYCGLYSTGNVKIGDNVYVHMPKNICATEL